MQVRGIEIQDSPWGGGRVRLRGEVCYQGNGGRAEEYWFDVPAEHAPYLSSSGNPWLVALLPLAVTLGEPLRVALPVDAALLENAARVMHIWRAWYPHLTVVPLEAEVAEKGAQPVPIRTVAFFSGGVDSFFTVLRPRQHAPPAERIPVEELLTVWGFDVPLDRPDAFARLRARHQAVAQELGKAYAEVATNLRATRWREANWSYHAHGSALVAVALSLEQRYHAVMIAGGGGYRGLHPWGSHLITDPLFSTSRTSVVYDSAAYLRTEKTVLIADVPLVRRALRVCYQSWTDENCGRCNKCRRTMITLELVGALVHCTTFPRRSIGVEEIAQMDCSFFADLREFGDIRELAVARGRADVAAALDRSVRRSRLRAGLRESRRYVGSVARRVLGRS